uniref:single-stranded DNA-binding protein n=1 Tax=Sulfurimonas sp. TaxID=2022749 RepID=UPI003D09EE0C
TSTGEKKDEVCFLDFNIFNRSAEVANQYLRKGSKVLLEGRLVFEQWTAQDGTNRSRHSLRVETMKILDSKENDTSSNQGYTSPDYQPAPGYEDRKSPTYADGLNQESSMDRKIPEIDIEEDEIPF